MGSLEVKGGHAVLLNDIANSSAVSQHMEVVSLPEHFRQDGDLN